MSVFLFGVDGDSSGIKRLKFVEEQNKRKKKNVCIA